jgi:signal transduction histidine kinase
MRRARSQLCPPDRNLFWRWARISKTPSRSWSKDNGLGFRPSIVPAARGLGLIGMRERAQALGGTFTIEKRVGGGTRVRVTLPFETTDGAAATPEQVAV